MFNFLKIYGKVIKSVQIIKKLDFSLMSESFAGRQ